MVINASNPKILIVDDDPAICQLVSRFLSYNNYQIKTAENAYQGRQLFEQLSPDLVILDVNLPDESGFTLCQEIRHTGTLVLMLTCMTDTNYILEGFAKGADDYLTKPFNLAILKAKITALLNRRQLGNNTLETGKNTLVFDGLSINVETAEVTLNNQVIPLTTLEFELLHFLATHPNKIWERGALIEQVWRENQEIGADRKVDVHIGQIRKKIDDLEGRLIKTVRGRGYMFKFPNHNHQ
ncbi:two component transcriptional regulator, winged helix family [Rippkaea orientalis PCC 8801]|uniref:Two component transcriptional regulator, winged helix family n=1 Tax=Rippkaea orientalis (strain PCC 8801 / RF-1) TaxID=41431 RepID=B7K2G1_RIPO1|nr:response regulator transcription factor [Rippkaea orientalis]ACK66354.1 two component transcriptional regulator, winged helix family [Rippkaea orientalis PCC 8801]